MKKPKIHLKNAEPPKFWGVVDRRSVLPPIRIDMRKKPK